MRRMYPSPQKTIKNQMNEINFSLDKPRKLFVTGATGFIGSTIIQKLLARGHFVTGLSRSKPTFPPGFVGTPESLWEHPNFMWVQGDIQSVETLKNVMSGAEGVFHLAGYAKNYSPDKSIYTKINVDGMRNVFIAAKELKVQKIVWTSSIVTFGPTAAGMTGDESMPRITDKYYTEYEQSKSIAEKEALQWAAEGLPVTIVNPARVYGPGQMSEGNAMTQLISDIMAGRMPFLPNCGVNIGNYVLVDDVAQGQILAMERGRIGQRYILGGENASLCEVFSKVEAITGKRHFKLKLLKFGPMLFARVQLLIAKLFGIYPRITPGWVATFVDDWVYSVEKARQELGYNPTGIDEGFTKTCQWLAEIEKKS